MFAATIKAPYSTKIALCEVYIYVINQPIKQLGGTVLKVLGCRLAKMEVESIVNILRL